MQNKEEKKILKLITIIPIILVICISVVATYLFIVDKSNYHNINKQELKDEFIKKNKELGKTKVNEIYDYIEYEKKNSEYFLKETLKQRTDEVYNIINSIYLKYHKTHSKKTIMRKIKDFLYDYRFNNGRGYFYLYDLDGENIMHPINKNIVGKNVLRKDFAYVSVSVKKIFKSLKNKDKAFCDIRWKKPKAEGTYRKITYNRVFKAYNLVIGTGEYLENYENNIKNKVLKYINSHSYSQNGYVFIYDYKGKALAHFYKKFINKNRWEFKDKRGVFIIKELINIVKEKKEGFLTYIASLKPETKKPSLKTSFIKGFDTWQWAIGTGFYQDDVDREISKIENYEDAEKQKDIMNILMISIVLTIITILFSYFISSILKKMFLAHKEELLLYVNENRKKDSILAQQSKMVAVGEMIQNISHQWRQPLSTISTVSTGLKMKKEYSMLKDEDFDEGIEKISFYTHYLSQTIDDFRDYFSPDKTIKEFELKQMVEKSLKLLDVQLSENNINVIYKLDNIKVCSSESMLIQVLLNLFSNAKDEFIKRENEEHFIFVDAKIEDEVVLLVKDNAGGINPENLDKIFEIYFSTKDKKEGSGIGLYMVDEIIKSLKGSIIVRNEEYSYNDKSYKGAVFEIKLPNGK